MQRFYPAPKPGMTATEGGVPSGSPEEVFSRGSASEASGARERGGPDAGPRRGRHGAAEPGAARSRAALPAAPAPAREAAAESPAVAARVSSAGGRLVSWQLKAYRANGATVWEEMVPLRAARAAAGPLSVRFSDDPESAAAPATLAVEGGVVTMTSRLSRGRTLVKRLTLPASGYLAKLELELAGPLPESLEVLWTPGVGLSPDEEALLRRPETYQNVPAALVLSRKDKLSQGEAKEAARKRVADPFWAAVRNKYFVAALIPPAPAACEGVTAVDGVAATDGSRNHLAAAVTFTLDPGARAARIPLALYAGPQQVDELEAAGARLEKVMDLGWFGWLALPMVRVLKFLAVFVVNYGVAIILLTLGVRAVLWFPSQWGLAQMKKMQALQPQMQFINEKFKDEPQRKQEMLMTLYREHKINPAGGCLPLLLQIPVFFALYTALANSIELRGAPFALWIRDLSAHDPIYVLPVLVTGTMWLQQVMMPVTGDPQQAKIMRWMTLAFGFMFLNMPSGLMLYWLASNMVQIAQQWKMNPSLAPWQVFARPKASAGDAAKPPAAKEKR